MKIITEKEIKETGRRVLDLCPELFKTVDVAIALKNEFTTLTESESLKLAVKIRKNNIQREATYQQRKSKKLDATDSSEQITYAKVYPPVVRPSLVLDEDHY